MLTLIKNIDIYAPEHLGRKDILIFNDRIERICGSINVPEGLTEIKVIDGSGLKAFPGFIDAHVHLIGGGGEGGFHTRTPEIKLTSLIKSGITTAVGCLGTDGVCRSMKSLIAKAYALEEEGISTYVYTGSYGIDVESLTNSVKEDIMIIPKIIGVGEIALSDHRSSQPTYESFASLIAEARVAGILSGKAGIVHVHLGDGKGKFSYIERLIKETEIPKTQIVPTHCNRSREVLDGAVKYGCMGGYVDLTTSSDDVSADNNELSASKALKTLLENGVPIDNIMFSSDGQGSLPKYDADGRFLGLGIGSVATLYDEVRKSILNEKIPIEKALKVITSNVSSALRLHKKGHIGEGMDADIVLVSHSNFEIKSVIAKGIEVVKDNEPLIKGTFEE